MVSELMGIQNFNFGIPAMPASTTQNIGYPSIMTPSKMGKTKNLIFYSLNDMFLIWLETVIVNPT